MLTFFLFISSFKFPLYLVLTLCRVFLFFFFLLRVVQWVFITVGVPRFKNALSVGILLVVM